jgi:hypothetical protein
MAVQKVSRNSRFITHETQILNHENILYVDSHWRTYKCYNMVEGKLKLFLSVEKLRKLELLFAETQVTFICGETPLVMQQET